MRRSVDREIARIHSVRGRSAQHHREATLVRPSPVARCTVIWNAGARRALYIDCTTSAGRCRRHFRSCPSRNPAVVAATPRRAAARPFVPFIFTSRSSPARLCAMKSNCGCNDIPRKDCDAKVPWNLNGTSLTASRLQDFLNTAALVAVAPTILLISVIVFVKQWSFESCSFIIREYILIRLKFCVVLLIKETWLY